MTDREQFEKWLEKRKEQSHAPIKGEEIWQAAQAVAVPEGWQVVPNGQTYAMRQAALETGCGLSEEGYEAMLAAAPNPT